MLRFPVRNKYRKLAKSAPVGGLQARIDKMRKLVTALIRHERLEGKYAYMHETRGYAERVRCVYVLLYNIGTYCSAT